MRALGRMVPSVPEMGSGEEEGFDPFADEPPSGGGSPFGGLGGLLPSANPTGPGGAGDAEGFDPFADESAPNGDDPFGFDPFADDDSSEEVDPFADDFADPFGDP